MQSYVDILNEGLKNKKSLCYEITSWNQPINKYPICNAIIELEKLNYNFTQSQFDKFIASIVCNKKKSMIATLDRSGYLELGSHNFYTKITDIMFSKFHISSKQFDSILACYDNIADKDVYHNQDGVGFVGFWIDSLIKYKYNFNKKQIDGLCSIGYNVHKIVGNNLSQDQLKAIILSNFRSLSNQECVELKKLSDDNTSVEIILLLIKTNNVWCDTSITTLHNFFNGLDIKSINDKIIDTIITINCNNSNKLVNYLFEQGLVPNDKLISYMTKNYSLNRCIFESGIQITTEIANSLILIGYMSLYIDSDMYSFFIKNGCKKELLDSCIVGNNLIYYKFFDALGISFNDETFNIACSKNNIGLFDICVQKHGLFPSDKHLSLCLNETLNMDFVNKLLSFKIIPDASHIDVLCKNTIVSVNQIQNTIELFIKHGLILDYGLVKKLLKHEVKINNLQRFNIKYDEDLYFLCYYYNEWYPLDQFEIDENKLNLRKLCRSKKTTLEQFNDYIQKYNIIPDKYCLDHALCYNPQIASEILQKLGYKPSLTSLYWFRQWYYIAEDHKIFRKYIKTFNITGEYMSQPLEK